MRNLLLLCSILQIAFCNCPDSFDIVKDGLCTGTVNRLICGSTTDCMSAQCSKHSADGGKPYTPILQPVTIHTDKQQSYWAEQSANVKQSIYIALQCNTNTYRWEWYDGSILDFKPFNNHNKYLDTNCSEQYDNYMGWFVDSTGYWNIESIGGPVFCIGQLDPREPAPNACGDFTENTENQLCYKIGLTAENFEGAQNDCATLGAELASIHTPQENSFVRQLASTNGADNGLLLGATENGTEWTWVDGTEWDFENYYEGYPKNGQGECLVMDTFSTTGKWLNINCSSELPFACVRAYLPTPACSSGPWKEGEEITSPGYPFDASIPCDFVLSVDPGKFVKVTIEELEANSCCDELLLADYEIGGKVLAKLTGHIVPTKPKTVNSASNLMRVSWQPQGGVNVKGFRMTYRAVDHADEEPLTTTTPEQTTQTTHTTPKPITMLLTTLEDTTTNLPLTTTDISTPTSTTVKPTTWTTVMTTTSGAANYGISIVSVALLSVFIH